MHFKIYTRFGDQPRIEHVLVTYHPHKLMLVGFTLVEALQKRVLIPILRVAAWQYTRLSSVLVPKTLLSANWNFVSVKPRSHHSASRLSLSSRHW